MPVTSPRMIPAGAPTKVKKVLERDPQEALGDSSDGIRDYYNIKIDELQYVVTEQTHNLRRLEAQRNELNAKGMLLMTE